MKFLKELIALFVSLFKISSTAVVKTIDHMDDETPSLDKDAYYILLSINTPLIKENIMTPISKAMRIDQILTLAAASFADVAGNAVSVANPIVWTIDNAALATLVPSPDGTSVVVTPTGTLGVAKITSTVNSNPDTATASVTVIGSAVVTIGAGLAVSVDLTATVVDSTEDQTATAPAEAVAPAAVAPAPAAVDPAPAAVEPAAVEPAPAVAPAVDAAPAVAAQ